MTCVGAVALTLDRNERAERVDVDQAGGGPVAEHAAARLESIRTTASDALHGAMSATASREVVQNANVAGSRAGWVGELS